MKRFKRLSHSLYECKYHFVLLSFAETEEYRYQIFKDDIAEYTRQQIYQLCKQKELVGNRPSINFSSAKWVKQLYTCSRIDPTLH